MVDSPSTVALTATLTVVWSAAWVDYKTLKIPNALSVSGVILGLLVHTWDSGLVGLWQALAGFGLGMALMLPGYLMQFTAAGDVKLMGAVGALLGPERLLSAFLFTILAAGAVGVAYGLVAWRARGATAPTKRYASMLRCLWATGRVNYVKPRPGEVMAEPMPMAVAIAIGSTVTTLWSL